MTLQRPAPAMLALFAGCAAQAPPAEPIAAAAPAPTALCAATGTGRPVQSEPEWWAEARPRSLLGVPCLLPCTPPPSCAIGEMLPNEEGGYGYLAIAPGACRLDGLPAPAGCTAVCDGAARVGELAIEYAVSEPAVRQSACAALTAWLGPPSQGACDQPDARWYAAGALPEARLSFGALTLSCGSPPGAFAPTAPF